MPVGPSLVMPSMTSLTVGLLHRNANASKQELIKLPQYCLALREKIGAITIFKDNCFRRPCRYIAGDNRAAEEYCLRYTHSITIRRCRPHHQVGFLQ